MRTDLISLKASRRTCLELKELAKAIIEGVASSGYYISPSPSLSVMNTLLTNYSNALTARGTAYNYAGKFKVTVLWETRVALENGLKQLQQFCVSQTPGNILAFQSANWPTIKSRQNVGVLGPVSNLRHKVENGVIQGWLKLRWNKPDGTANVKIPAFRVMRSATKDFSSAVEIAMVTKMEFIDKTVGNDTFYYWVIPVNAYGDGAVSGICVARSSQITA